MELTQEAAHLGTKFANYAMHCGAAPSSQTRCVEPSPHDKRFSGDAWQQWPYNLISQGFLLQEQWWVSATVGIRAEEGFKKIDEIPFDFERRRMSVVLERGDGAHILICKGAVEEVFAVCTRYTIGDEVGALDESHFAAAKETTAKLNADGFRVIARRVQRDAASANGIFRRG